MDLEVFGKLHRINWYYWWCWKTPGQKPLYPQQNNDVMMWFERRKAGANQSRSYSGHKIKEQKNNHNLSEKTLTMYYSRFNARCSHQRNGGTITCKKVEHNNIELFLVILLVIKCKMLPSTRWVYNYLQSIIITQKNSGNYTSCIGYALI